ncbi:hypothetical protein FHX77_001216 [Bifidobacterium commune]|uniref:Uncharacterized protein n=1 Tax=Bifidobacterium commune TaxID=1505727 RepID=A0A1C4H5V0_9BIFI|nr:hypothetical protein [Bifidobacterium commune]MBB2955784.1 hypothetical protein [Bifidobacterium commune]SCC80058.1 hypothetical protein GA0061077_0972 [Bifidobacterium commune]
MLFVELAAKPIKKWQNDVQNASMDMTMNVQEATSAMRMLKAYNAVPFEKGKLRNSVSRAFTFGKN